VRADILTVKTLDLCPADIASIGNKFEHAFVSVYGSRVAQETQDLQLL
jgi:hypothetical protein